MLGVAGKIFKKDSSPETIFQVLFVLSLAVSLSIAAYFGAMHSRMHIDNLRSELHQEHRRHNEALHRTRSLEISRSISTAKEHNELVQKHVQDRMNESLTRFAEENKAAAQLSKCETILLIPFI